MTHTLARRSRTLAALAVRAIAFDADGDVTFELPEDLTALSDSDIEGLAARAQELFDALRAVDPRDLTAEQRAERLATMTGLAEAKVACRSALTEREAATRAAEAEVEALAAAMNPADPEDPDTEGEEDPDAEGDGDAPVEDPPADAALPLAASATPQARRMRIPAATMRQAMPRAAQTNQSIAEYARAAARLQGFSTGQGMTIRDMATAYARLEESAPVASIRQAVRAGQSLSARTPIASIRIPHARTAQVDSDDPEIVEAAIARATNETLLPGGALTAAGGWCFAAGTLVQTPDGLIPIEDMSVDDMVITGAGQARRVALVLTREAQILDFAAHGARTRVTAEHPMWARRRRVTAGGNKVTAGGDQVFGDPAWIPAGMLKPGDRVGFAMDALRSAPTVLTSFLSDVSDEVAEARAYVLGRYLGDGWTSRKRVAGNGRNDMDASYLCSSHTEGDGVEKALIQAEVGFSRREYPTVTQFGLTAAFRDWAAEIGTGRGAHDKAVPSVVFGWPDALRAAVLRGYTDADGHTVAQDGRSPRTETSTVSRALAVSVAMLVRTLGMSPGLTQRTIPDSKIGDRTVQGGLTFDVSWVAGAQTKTRFEVADGVMWETVQSIAPAEHGTVWDITVDDIEHSFIADGMVVHNCSPSETLYNLCSLESADGLISLPTLNPRRGGIRNTLGPDWASILTATGFCFTEAQDIAGAYGDNETWTLTEGGSGLTSWTLTWNGSTTGSLDDDVVAADVQTALNALGSAISSGTTFTVTGGPLASAAFTVTVAGWNSNTNVPAPTTTPTGGTGVVTVATTNAGGDTASGKPCNTITCPEFTDNRLGVCGVCIQTGILMSRSYPELVERMIRGSLTAHMHRVAGRHIANIITGSTPVTVTDGDTNPGAVAPLLSAVELTIESIRNAYRMRDGATMEVILPRWGRGLLRADLSRRLGVNLLAVTNQDLDNWLRMRGANPQWVYNFDPIGAAPTAWPTSMRILVYPAGTWVALQGDVINLESVYDSTNLANNNYTSIFTEEATATMKACHVSRVVTVPVCPSGATGAGEDLVCAES